MPQSITIWQAASPETCQVFMLVGVAVLVPPIPGHAARAYWAFRGKVKPGSRYHCCLASKKPGRWHGACCGSRPFGSAATAR